MAMRDYMSIKNITIITEKVENSQTEYLPYAKPIKTYTVDIDGVKIGSENPVVVQVMTNTDTADINSTVNQIIELQQAGAEMVRFTVNNIESAKSIPAIAEKLAQKNISVPLIGDFHYNGDMLLREFPESAKLLAKYRINPGNAGSGNKKNRAFATFIETAVKFDKAIRIGVNWGSLDSELLQKLMDENAKRAEPLPSWAIMRQALVDSAIESAALAQSLGMPANKIILSCKVSNIADLIAVNRALAKRSQYPIHLGLTEAGLGDKGVTASALGIGTLLTEGIGNTIRVSLTPYPGESRTREVLVAQEILQSLGLRNFYPAVTACPGCGRTTSDFFQKLADTVQKYLRAQMPIWQKEKPLAAKMKVAVMGCVVNGPGESKHADIGISLPGTGESPATPIFIDGKHTKTLRGDNIDKQFIEIIKEYVRMKY